MEKPANLINMATNSTLNIFDWFTLKSFSVQNPETPIFLWLADDIKILVDEELFLKIPNLTIKKITILPDPERSSQRNGKYTTVARQETGGFILPRFSITIAPFKEITPDPTQFNPIPEKFLERAAQSPVAIHATTPETKLVCFQCDQLDPKIQTTLLEQVTMDNWKVVRNSIAHLFRVSLARGNDPILHEGISIPDVLQHPVVISLRERTDRMKTFNERFHQATGNYPTVFEAYPKPPPQITVAIKTLLTHRGGGAVGCLQSHYGVVKMAKAMDWDNVMIMEDDAVFSEGFKEQVTEVVKSLPLDWDIFYIGSVKIFGEIGIARNIGWGNNLYGTHCYVVNRKCYDRYIDLCQTYELPIDELMGRNRDLYIYSCLPSLAWQTPEDMGNIAGRGIFHDMNAVPEKDTFKYIK